MSAKARRKITIRAIGVAFCVLMLFALFGESVLGFVGISMPAFRVAGGILLFLTALDMLFQRRTKRREDQSEEEADDPSVFPLAIPLIAGPGSITTIILIAGAAPGPIGLASAGLVALAGLITVFIFFSTADGLEKLLGKTGIDVVTRLLGMLLAALSVQFILEGFFAFLPANGGAV
jgi:multiple antibiotic resistance protein